MMIEPMSGETRLTRLAVNAVFAGAGGLLGSFTFLGHGHTFANSMTGNLVLLGLSTVQRDWSPASHHLAAYAVLCSAFQWRDRCEKAIW
jgi:uncharacterized membrane protein YoaK (UPF0700 family)